MNRAVLYRIVGPFVIIRATASTNGSMGKPDFQLFVYSVTFTPPRVELNAMTSEQLIGWLESKLEEHGVEKMVPNDDLLARAYRRAVGRARAQDAIEEVTRDLDNVAVPDGLGDQVRDYLDENPAETWDDAVGAVMEDTETEE